MAGNQRVLRSGALFLLILALGFSPVIIKARAADAPVQSADLPRQIGADEWTDETAVIRYEKICETEAGALYADLRNGIFAVKLSDGTIWYSTPPDALLDEKSKGARKMLMRSQLAIQYFYQGDQLSMSQPETANSQSACVNNESVTVEPLKNGIRVIYDFTELEIVIPVDYTLEQDYLKARVAVKEIKEKGECMLTSVQLLPAFGAGNWEDEGYLLIPDGCGALIRFNNGKNTPVYDRAVYGDEQAVFDEYREKQAETVRLPVFGARRGGRGYLGVITGGDAYAHIVGIGGHAESAYNAASARFDYRTLSSMTLFSQNWDNRQPLYRSSDIFRQSRAYEVRYYFLGETDGNYAGMAARYRKYLTEEKGLKKQTQPPALNVDLYGSVEKPASFLGIKYQKKLALTTFSQAEEIIRNLQSEGVSALSIRYLGWQNGGALNVRLPRKASPMPILGGSRRWQALVDFAREQKIAMYPDTDFILHRKGASGDAAKSAFGKTVYQQEYLRSVGAVRLGIEGLRLATPAAAARSAEKYLASYQKLGHGAVSLSAFGSRLYSTLSPRSPATRETMQKAVLAVLEDYKSAGLELLFEQANAYAAPYAAKIIDAPSSCSGFDLFDDEVPFYQIVFHASVPMSTAAMTHTDARVNFLKTVETGSELSYTGIHAHASVLTDTRFDHLYSTTADFWMKTAAAQYGRYHPLLEKIAQRPIIAHETAGLVTQTTFEGGLRIFVNYGSEEAKVGDVVVPPMDFAVTGDG